MTVNDGYEYDIIPAVDAKSIYNFDVVYDRSEKKDIDESTEDLLNTDGETEDENLASAIPVSLDLNRMPVRWILFLTFNFSRNQLKIRDRLLEYRVRGCILNLLQLIFVCLLCVYLAFTFGWVKFGQLQTLIVGDEKFFFTKAYDIIWELKWFITCILGLLYHRSGHLELFCSQIKIPKGLWRKTLRNGFFYLLFVIFVVIIAPVVFHGMRVYSLFQGMKQTLVCTTMFLLFRLMTAPSFCVVTAVLYLVKVQIDLLGRMLQGLQLSFGTPYALREIRAVKAMIRKVDVRLKYYLLFHVLLILFTTFTGIFSLIERVELKFPDANSSISLKEFRQISPGTKLNMRTIALYREMEELRRRVSKASQLNTKLEKLKQLGKEKPSMHRKFEENLDVLRRKLESLTIAALENTQKMNAISSAKNTTIQLKTKSGQSKVLEVFLQETKTARVFLESFVQLLEVTVLFVIPLLFLFWHKRALLRITDVIYDLDIEDQRRDGLSIQNDETKDKIVNNLKSMRGVTIFGMEVNFFRTVFLAVLAPFLTVTLKALFEEYNLSFK